MNSIKRNIPNFITLVNLFCGLVAIVSCFQDNLQLAGFFIFIGATLDFFDGLTARLLKVNSEIGKPLDSIADMTTFGVAPGIIMFQLILSNYDTENSYMPYIGFIITLFSAIRLARFNIDKKQSSSFIGLPTPANAIFILSLPLILIFQPEAWIVEIILNKWFLVVITILSCFMLNAEIPLFALKFKNFNLKENWFRFFFLFFALVMIIFLQFIALPIIIISYVLLSLILNSTLKKEE